MTTPTDLDAAARLAATARATLVPFDPCEVRALGVLLEQLIGEERQRRTKDATRGRTPATATTEDAKLVEATCQALQRQRGPGAPRFTLGDLAVHLGWARTSASVFNPKALAARGLSTELRGKFEDIIRLSRPDAP